ncbi:MAG: FAD-dependent oxidoreductase, partial [Melioribacteraceae bacterium]
QDVASYIKLVEQQKYEEAFELIVSKNPLPHITGYICDHQCMYHCTRWDYDSPVLIRDLKKEAAENGYNGYLTKFKNDFKKINNGIRTAVIGAGPSGLSAGYFLVKAGFDVTIFEKEKNAGGIVRNVLPKFRIPEEAIEKDIRFIEMHGIRFVYGINPGFSIEKLKGEGFKYIYVAIGAEEANQISLAGNGENIFDAIEFLKSFQKKNAINPGRTVAVIGGGNSAMDSARAAKRGAGVEKVYIIYRRTAEQMPADKEEFNSAIKEGAEFMELLLPVKFEDSILTCQKMELVNNDPGERKSVVPVEDAFIELRIDTLISAIGEHVDIRILTDNKLEMTKNRVIVSDFNETNRENVFIGGDALRGPSTVIESIADGRTAAEAIIQRENRPRIPEPTVQLFQTDETTLNGYRDRRGKLSFPSEKKLTKEAERCLGCNFICNKCVEVCPNRANVTIETGSSEFKDSNQILHMDALCNECGNCTTFCPYQGDPYKDKITLFWGEKEFHESKNDGFFLRRSEDESRAELRWEGKNGTIIFDKNGDIVKSSAPGYYGSDELIKMMKIVLHNYMYLLPG